MGDRGRLAGLICMVTNGDDSESNDLLYRNFEGVPLFFKLIGVPCCCGDAFIAAVTTGIVSDSVSGRERCGHFVGKLPASVGVATSALDTGRKRVKDTNPHMLTLLV